MHSFPIDPYSTKYWVQNKHTLPSSTRSQLFPSSASLMQPPRLPLHASNQTNILLSPNPATMEEAQQPSTTGPENGISPSKRSLVQQTSRAPQKPLRLISNELLPAFRQAVSGSDLNKVGLVEILKKQYAVSSFVPGQAGH
jgi:chromatin assembly factor 1 subunit A